MLQFGPTMICGNLMKLSSSHSIFNENKFQLRFFTLDLKQAIFKYGEHGFAKQKVYKLTEVNGAEIVAEPDTRAKEYMYTFVVRCVDRDLYLGSKSPPERQAWINGFNVFFEYRQLMNKELDKITPGLSQELQQKGPTEQAQIKADKLRLRSKSKGTKAQEIVKALNLKGIAQVLKMKNIPKEETKGNTDPTQMPLNDKDQLVNITNLLNGQNGQLSQQEQQQLLEMQQLRLKVLSEYEELEKKREEFNKEKEDFRLYQEGEILRLSKEKLEVENLKNLYESKLKELNVDPSTPKQENNDDEVKFCLDNNILHKNLKIMTPNKESPQKSPGKFSRKNKQSSDSGNNNSQNLRLSSSQTRKKSSKREKDLSNTINHQENNEQSDQQNSNGSNSGGNGTNTTILDDGAERQQRTFSRKKVKVTKGRSNYNSQGQSKDFIHNNSNGFAFLNANKFQEINADDIVSKFDNNLDQENKDFNTKNKTQNSNSEADDEKSKTVVLDHQVIENIDNDGQHIREITQTFSKKVRGRRDYSKSRKENIIIDGFQELEDDDNKQEPDFQKQNSGNSQVGNTSNTIAPPSIQVGKMQMRIAGKSTSIQYESQHLSLVVNHNNENGNSDRSDANKNNTSTIDQLIEKERDVQFLERLDKQNRMNLQLQKSQSHKSNNNSFVMNNGDDYENHSNNSGPQSYNQQRNNKFSNHAYNNDNDQNNNWDGLINIPDLSQQKSAKLNQMLSNQSKFAPHSRQANNPLDRSNPSHKTQNVEMKQEMKVDIPLESFDANWDDDIEASRGSKTAQAKAKGKGKKLEINIDSDDNLSDQDLDNDDLQPLDKKQLEFWKRKPTQQQQREPDNYGDDDDKRDSRTDKSSVRRRRKQQNLRSQEESKRPTTKGRRKRKTPKSDEDDSYGEYYDDEYGNEDNSGDDMKKNNVGQDEPEPYNPLVDDNTKQAEFLEQFGILKIFLGIILFWSLFLTCFGFIGYSQVRFDVLAWVGGLCMFLNMLWLFGLIAVFRVEKDLHRVYYPNLSGTIGFEMLIVFFCFCAILMIMFVYLAISCLLTIETSLAELGSLASYPDNWYPVYGNFTVGAISTLTRMYFYITAAVCFLLAFLLLVLFIYSIRIGATQKSNRITAFFLTFNNVLIPFITLVLFYFVFYAEQQVTKLPIIGDQFMPNNVVSTLIAFAVIIIALIFLGFAGIITESKIIIEVYTMILSICTVAIICETAFVTYYAFSFDSYYSTNWGKLTMYVDKSYFTTETMGCYGGKYLFNQNSTNYYNLKCDNKNVIAYMWENQLDKDIVDQEVRYGCINLGCVDVFGQWISSKLKYLALIGYTLIAVALVMIGISYYVWRKLANGQEKIMWHHRAVEILLLLVTLIILIIMSTLIGVYYPVAPTTFEYAVEYPSELSSAEVNTNSIKLNDDLLQPNRIWFPVYGIQINEDDSVCKPDCTDINYYIQFTTLYGEIVVNTTAYDSDMESYSGAPGSLTYNDTNGFVNPVTYSYGFYGTVIQINTALDNLLFKPECPFVTGMTIWVTIKAQAIDGRSANGMIASATAGESTSIMGTTIYTIVSQSISADQVSTSNSVTFYGRVQDIDGYDSLEGVSVTANYYTYNCANKTTTTNSAGEFSLTFYLMNNNLPYEVSFTYDYSDYLQTQQLYWFGGIVTDSTKYHSEYVMPDETLFSAYQASMIDSVSFDSVTTPIVYIYNGGNTTNVTVQSYIAQLSTNSNGSVSYLSESPGQFMITAHDTTGIYNQYLDPRIYLYGTDQNQRYIVLNKNTDTSYKMRLVLTWTSGEYNSTYNRDLDMFVDFQVDDATICSVGFYNPLCQGVESNFDGQNNHEDITNAETISFKAIGAYTYIVYVGEYLNKTRILNPEIYDTEARVDMYVQGYDQGPIANFIVPWEQTTVSEDTTRPYRYWGVFCFSGANTLNKVTSLNYLSSVKPNITTCDL